MMSDEQLTVSVAELDGWTWWRCDSLNTTVFRNQGVITDVSGVYIWYQITRPIGWEKITINPPKYLFSTDAMQKVEKRRVKDWTMYIELLKMECNPNNEADDEWIYPEMRLVQANGRQRVIALLRLYQVVID